jgi:soluble lytic murein transglycosylase
MSRHPSLRPSLVSALLLVVATGSGCRRDAPPPPLRTAADEAVPEGDEDDDPVAEVLRARSLWFPSGPGHEAILARERQDHEAATRHLDALLAMPGLSEAERGAAQWLRGLEDLRLERYEAAADRFAEARKARALAPVELRLRALEAQARLDAGDPSTALALVTAIDATERESSPLFGDLLVIEADARARTRDPEGAVATYERHLRKVRNGRRLEVMIKLARVLAASDGDPARKRALELFEELLVTTPLSDYGQEAEGMVATLREQVGAPKEPELRAFERKVALARLGAMLDRRQYANAIRAADVLLGKKLDDADACQVLYSKASAIFKQRKRAASRPVFDAAVTACTKAGKGHEDLLVRSWYQAGRGLYAEGKYAKAAESFERLARAHASHSYADDAWVLAGESWSEHGDLEKAKEAFRAALRIEHGDMNDEARRRLLVQAFADGDDDEVLALVEQGLKRRPGGAGQGKLLYFRGRALARKGDAEGARAAWVEVLQVSPLDYPALQALSRLREAGPDALREGLAVLGDPGMPRAEHEPELPDTPGATRALILARLGLGKEAREELEHADVSGWPAVSVLNQAGLWSEGQKLLASMASGWRAEPPSSANRRRWEQAYPRPFDDIIDEGERSHGVPSLLTFAIMQTESRFDPGVTSWAGAKGLVQLMPATAKGVAQSAGIRIERDEMLYDPVLNLDLGMRYLGGLVGRFGGTEAAAALAIPSYNGGAGNVNKWKTQRSDWDLDLFIEAIPFDETRKYTQRVLGRWLAYRWLYGSGPPEDRVPHLPLAAW